MTDRLQKIISAAGLMSRRTAEEYIKAGRVSVNGILAQLGDKADPERDTILVDGKALPTGNEKVYIMLNKPKGYVTTMSDEKGRKCVTELVRRAGARIYPVGRLDMYSEGLLIMTNDGEFANKLMHPKHNISKTYMTWVSGENIERSVELLRKPMEIDGYTVCAQKVERAEKDVLSITIGEGRNRQVRKMCEQAGLKVTRLCRISEGAVSLGELEPGKWRYLTREEIDSL